VTPTIRPLAPTDAPRAAELLGQLGYPSSAESIPRRLARMAGERETAVVVAEMRGALTGLAAAQIVHAITSEEPIGILMALVIDEKSRGTGVGKALVAHVEAWVRGKGLAKLIVLTATYREDAHRFYEHLGYTKNGFRYIKSLDRKR